MFNLVFVSRITLQPREHGTQECSLEETIQVGVQMVSYPVSFNNEHRPFQCEKTQVHLLCSPANERHDVISYYSPIRHARSFE